MDPEFDGLYVVSDLHLGGRRGAEVFDSSEELAAFIHWVAGRAVSERIGLVIAGDIVDFLAFDGACYFNSDRAVEDLLSLNGAEAPTRVVFDALKELTAAPKGRLVLLVGNHDIELALPPVRDALLGLVAKGEAAVARVTMHFDGTGYSCRVGGKLVVCLHGNECDDWNAIDHAALRRRIRDSVARRAPATWNANGGTRLVIDVMNPIKRGLPFVDLLKPEDSAVPKILLALDRERRGLGIREAALRAAGIAKAKLALGYRRRTDTLSRAGALEQEAEEQAFVPEVPLVDESTLHQQAEDDLRHSRKPLDVVEPGAVNLSIRGTLALAFGIGVEENLRAELEWIWARDDSFDPAVADGTFEALDAWIGRDVDVLVAGHTHLEKHIESSRRRGGVYLNSGTWIRLIRLRRKQLSQENFGALLDALTVRSLKDLDDAKVADLPIVLRRRTVAFVAHDTALGKVVAGLKHVRAAATKESPFVDDLEVKTTQFEPIRGAR